MRRLLVFLKDPQPGRVKTRLSKDIGEQAAEQIYRACVELSLERLQALRHVTVLCVDPPEAASHLRDWVGRRWNTWPQQGADLGERMARATTRAFIQGARQVLVLGTDSPWIHEALVREAFEALSTAEVVLGPTEDGGYYLIGLARPCPDLFSGIAWSSPQVFAQTCEKARGLGLRTTTVREGYDVDQVKDVQRFVQEAQRWASVPAAVGMMDVLRREAMTCRS